MEEKISLLEKENDQLMNYVQIMNYETNCTL